MLMIAIPKSASTSLMKTFGQVHNVNALQDFSFSKNPEIDELNILHKIHSDIREITAYEVEKFTNKNCFYKQHIYPSKNNVALLKEVKKVILFRDIKEIILAYRRGAKRNVHTLIDGYSTNMSEPEWLKRSKKDGLYDDLLNFKKKWEKNASDNNTLFITYSEIVNSPHEVLNKIEDFYELPITRENVKLAKARYSRRNKYINLILKYRNKLFSILKKFLLGRSSR